LDGRQDGKIATSQVIVAMSSFIFGSGIVTLPRAVSEETGTPDVWISILLGGLISICLGIVCAKLSQRFPEQTFYQFTPVLVGKPIGYLLSIIFIIFMLMTGAYQIRIQAEVIRHFLLDETPIQFMAICFLAVSTYLVAGGINPMVRLFELLFPLTTIVIFLVMLLSMQNFEVDHFRPVLSEGILPALKGLKAAALPFEGFEIIMFLTAFMSEPQKAVKAVVISNLFSIVIYLTVIVMVIGSLTVNEVKTLTWPTIEVIRTIEFPGAFFSNFEILFIAVWVIEMFTTLVASYYLASLGMSQLFSANIKYFYYGLLPFIYYLAFYPQDINSVFKLGEINGYVAMFIAGVAPIFLLLIAKIRGM
jgi:spore germination protein